MSNFQAWYENADMPTKGEDGKWFDLEDGLQYDPTFYRESPEKKQLSAKSIAHRQQAKFFGGKALRGTAKQKEWAEKIRSEKIQSMSAEAAELICDPSGLCTHSKFWIENRKKPAEEFEAYILTQKSLLSDYKSAQKANDTIQAARIASLYNSLTAEWNCAK